MVFTSNTVADVFIIIGIVVGGILLLLAVGFCIWRLARPKLSPGRSGAFKQSGDGGVDNNNDAVSALSKISRDQWHQRAQQEVKRPVVIEKDDTGQVIIKNPSAISKSEYRNNPGEFEAMDKQDRNVATLSDSQQPVVTVYNRRMVEPESVSQISELRVGLEGRTEFNQMIGLISLRNSVFQKEPTATPTKPIFCLSLAAPNYRETRRHTAACHAKCQSTETSQELGALRKNRDPRQPIWAEKK